MRVLKLIILKIRKLLWRILGINYNSIIRKTDYIMLKEDKYVTKGIHTYDNGAKVWRWTNTPLTIGKYCSIAYDVNFIVDEGYHSLSEITSYPLINKLALLNNKTITEFSKQKSISIQQKKGITIGNDVWIGMGAYILPSVKIGNGVTIAANSVVTKDIPDYCIAGGVPAKIIKVKHDSKIITTLNNIAWWNWDEEIIKERIQDFYIPISEFLNKYR